MQQETYPKTVICENCKRDQKIEIPKGQTVEEYLAKDNTCPNCGCKTLYYGRRRSVKGE